MASEMAALIGARIREAREQKGLSQKDLGNLLPGVVGGDQVSKWERGAHRPHDDTLVAIATALDIDLATLIAPSVKNGSATTPDPFPAKVGDLAGPIAALQDAVTELRAAVVGLAADNATLLRELRDKLDTDRRGERPGEDG